MSTRKKKKAALSGFRMMWLRRAWTVSRGAVGRMLAVGGLLATAGGALAIVERTVEAEIASRARAKWVFEGVPARVSDLVTEDLAKRLEGLSARDWTDPQLCSEAAQVVGQSPWVNEVRRVRRVSDGTIRIELACLEPFAMVDAGNGYALVDRDGVRLPGLYAFHQTWKLIQGVAAAPPGAGRRWDGADLHAALSLLARLKCEAFADQITGVLVHNFSGRNNPLMAHIELATDRAGGRIRWGSAPGSELIENSVEEKLALLRANHRLTGRADAGYPVIDVVTYPDRFVIPGAE
ncbi:MAG: hypothetical protein KJ057_04585 [Phycisphaerae bacterium]|nr:hypothetical protein [Planctomycetia bacterium]MCL4717735.1 hypothetical protein [Phycisphaerae bacterium]MCQ3919782.1 hypothetical protein [Planctomycetota bacterium]NUQ09378.1 hypothetical protein [Phycisphaerae bacterium]